MRTIIDGSRPTPPAPLLFPAAQSKTRPTAPSVLKKASASHVLSEHHSVKHGSRSNLIVVDATWLERAELALSRLENENAEAQRRDAAEIELSHLRNCVKTQAKSAGLSVPEDLTDSAQALMAFTAMKDAFVSARANSRSLFDRVQHLEEQIKVYRKHAVLPDATNRERTALWVGSLKPDTRDSDASLSQKTTPRRGQSPRTFNSKLEYDSDAMSDYNVSTSARSFQEPRLPSPPRPMLQSADRSLSASMISNSTLRSRWTGNPATDGVPVGDSMDSVISDYSVQSDYSLSQGTTARIADKLPQEPRIRPPPRPTSRSTVFDPGFSQTTDFTKGLASGSTAPYTRNGTDHAKQPGDFDREAAKAKILQDLGLPSWLLR